MLLRQKKGRVTVSNDDDYEGMRPASRVRVEIDERYRWRLQDIFPDWQAWDNACDELSQCIEHYEGMKGRLAEGAETLYNVMRLADDLGQLSYRVHYYPTLMHDEDQRDNDVDARRQRASMILARATQATSWFNPELLALSLPVVHEWLERHQGLALYRFALEEVFRQQDHVLDVQGERLLSLGSRFQGSPAEAYSALTTADVRFPSVVLESGEEVTVTYGKYRVILAENRAQSDRASAFRALYGLYDQHINTYAALYAAVAERDVFLARARRYESSLHAALHGDDIPTRVVETLIETTRAGAEPLRRYHRLRRRVLGLEQYFLYDGFIPLIELQRRYSYDAAMELVIQSVSPLGTRYQEDVRQAFAERWIDVYENDGKRSGAYSAPVYGVHPYMLLNYNDTLDDVFTLAHEMGHSMHTLLSHRHQPFVYSAYTIFVAEVASTLNEALLLEQMLAEATDPRERVVLLQRAIDSVCATFYSQVLFADWELEAHRQLERGKPLTADSLSELYDGLMRAYYGTHADGVDEEPLYARTWARIPHFFRSPFYVYQYATCFASSAQLLRLFRAGGADRARAVDAYLKLLCSGGNAHPMTQLERAGVDLTRPEPIQAVVEQLGALVDELEQNLARLEA